MTTTTTPDKMAANDHKLQDEARALLAALRASRRQRQKKPLPEGQQFTLGQEVADHVAAFMRHWDPYPVILLSLALSFPSRRRRTVHHDEPKPPGRDRLPGHRQRLQGQHQGRARNRIAAPLKSGIKHLASRTDQSLVGSTVPTSLI